MKNRKLFFKRFVMGIVIFFMAVFELQMIWGSVYISKTVTKERRNSYASALEIYSSNLEQQLKQIDDFLLQSVMIENDARSILEKYRLLQSYPIYGFGCWQIMRLFRPMWILTQADLNTIEII